MVLIVQYFINMRFLSLIIACLTPLSNPSSYAVDDWLGKKVFFKETAVVMVGNEVIDKYKSIYLPSEVEEVKGDLLRLRGYWLSKSDCMQLNDAFDFQCEEVRTKPKSTRALLHRATCWIEKGRLEEASQDLRHAISLDSSDAILFKYSGDVKYDQEDFVGAIIDYDRAIQLDKNYANAYFMRGRSQFMLRDYSAALTSIDACIAITPSLVVAYSDRGDVNIQLENFDAAIKDFDDAISQCLDSNPRDMYLSNPGDIYLNRGHCKSILRRYREAIMDFDSAIQKNPLNDNAFMSRGNARAQLGDYANAVEDFGKAVHLAPAESMHRYMRGTVYALLDNFGAAIDDLQAAIHLETDNQPWKDTVTQAKSQLSIILSCVADESLRNPNLALKLANEAVISDSDNPYVKNSKSCALAAKGNFKAAILIQEGINDLEWKRDKSIYGGFHAKDRIDTWNVNNQWKVSSFLVE